jgi:hypothetical protein
MARFTSIKCLQLLSVCLFAGANHSAGITAGGARGLSRVRGEGGKRWGPKEAKDCEGVLSFERGWGALVPLQ